MIVREHLPVLRLFSEVCDLQPILFLWLNAEKMLPFLRQESEVARLATIYLKWSSLGLPADAFNAISRHVCCPFLQLYGFLIDFDTHAHPHRRYFQSQGKCPNLDVSRTQEH
jgi:hypothetical protein